MMFMYLFIHECGFHDHTWLYMFLKFLEMCLNLETAFKLGNRSALYVFLHPWHDVLGFI